MKKKLSLLLALAMLLSLTACSLNIGNKYDTNTGPEDETGSSTAQPQQPDEPEDGDQPTQGTEPVIPAPAEPAAPAPEEPDGEDQDNDDAAPVVYVSHTDVTLKYTGETFRFTVWNSEGAAPDSCTYTSADPAVASVDEAGGEVTAVAPGTTTITVRASFGGEQQDFDCIVRCVWEESEPSLPVSGGAELPSLTDFFATLQENYDALGAMMVMEGELLENYYPGLSSIAAVEEIYILETMISVSNVAVGLVKLSENATLDDLIAVQDILQARITTQANGGAWYPESCETWNQGVITSVSNVVGMFVYPAEAQSMADLFTDTFSN